MASSPPGSSPALPRSGQPGCCWVSEHGVLVRDRPRPGLGKDREGRGLDGLGPPERRRPGRREGGRGLPVGKLPAFSCDSPRTTMPPQGPLSPSFLSADEGPPRLPPRLPRFSAARCSVCAVAHPAERAGPPRPAPRPASPRGPAASVGPVGGLPSLPLKDWFPPVLPRLPTRLSLCRLPSELICR